MLEYSKKIHHIGYQKNDYICLMKNIPFFLVVLIFGLLACRKGDGNIQKIDQKIRLYIDSSGIDMLNPTNEFAYKQMSFNDVYADVENAPVSFVTGNDKDTIYYREYLAGATRRLVDSSDAQNLIYESKIALKLTTNYNQQNINTYDTLILKYKSQPNLFQIYQVYYNQQALTIQQIDSTNVVKMMK